MGTYQRIQSTRTETPGKAGPIPNGKQHVALIDQDQGIASFGGGTLPHP